MMGIGPPPEFNPQDVTPPALVDRSWPVMALALDIAGKCNLACRYCAESATQPQRSSMNLATLDSAWAFLFPEGRLRSNVSIRIGSGEPLLALPLLYRLKELMDRGHASGEKRYMPSVFITTNGTLIKKGVDEWLAASGWNVKISLDGPAKVHDAWRLAPDGRGTFSVVSSAAASLVKLMPQRFSVTAVLCHGTDPQAVFGAVEKLGVRQIELVPVAHRDVNVRLQPTDIRSYEKFVQSYIQRYETEGRTAAIPILVRLSNCIARVMGYNNLRVPCGAGRSFLAVDPNGKLYPCFRFIGIERYVLGSLSKGLDWGAVQVFQRGPGRTYEKRTTCYRCWAAPLCGGPCFACAELFGPGNGNPVESHCSYMLADARAAVTLVTGLKRKNPERLLPFIPKTEDVKWP